MAARQRAAEFQRVAEMQRAAEMQVPILPSSFLFSVAVVGLGSCTWIVQRSSKATLRVWTGAQSPCVDCVNFGPGRQSIDRRKHCGSQWPSARIVPNTMSVVHEQRLVEMQWAVQFGPCSMRPWC